MARFDGLVIENFRGAMSPLHISFDSSKSIAVIFGENGTGKTTIVDAIDLVANGKVGSIREKSSTSVSAHTPSMGKAAADIRVAVTSRDGTWTGSLKSSKVVVTPVPGPRVRILRRTNLQRFIEAKPADRYLELRSFIAVDQIEKAERALNDAANRAANAADQYARDRESALEILQGIWQEEGSLGTDAVSWAESEIIRDAQHVEAHLHAYRRTADLLAALINAAREYQDASAFSDAADTELRSLLADLGRDQGIDAQVAMDLSRTLENVQRFFDAGGSGDTCPVCEQPVVMEQLRYQVAARLEDLEAYRRLDEQRAAARQKCRSAADRVMKRQRLLLEAASDVSRALVEDHVDRDGLRLTPRDDGKPEPGDVASALELAKRAESDLAVVQDKRDRLARRSGRNSSLSHALTSIREAEAEAGLAVSRQAALKKAADILRLERHQYSRELLEKVTDETNRYYEAIHPNEGLAISKLELDPKQRASLHQGVRFGDAVDVPPQAYFSEAHLDTLGFCFWLAMAKLDTEPEPPVLVIDDVFGSADAQHMSRIVDLIAAEANSFAQVIVTTHHRSLRDRFKKTGKDQCLELDSRWSLLRGVRLRRDTSLVDDLRKAIGADDFDRQAIASKAGILLEQVLDELALRYRLSLPRLENPEYVLSDLLSCTKKLMKVLKVQHPGAPEPASPLAAYTAIDQLSFIRNQVGAHFNLIGMDVSDREVEAFGRSTVELVDVLTCRRCRQVPSVPDATAFRCRCEKDFRAMMMPLNPPR